MAAMMLLYLLQVSRFVLLSVGFEEFNDRGGHLYSVVHFLNVINKKQGKIFSKRFLLPRLFTPRRPTTTHSGCQITPKSQTLLELCKYCFITLDLNLVH